jgi:hypothetical protein
MSRLPVSPWRTLPLALALVCGLAVPPAGAEGPAANVRVFVADMAAWGEIANLNLFPDDTVELILAVDDGEGTPARGLTVELASGLGNLIVPSTVETDEDGEAVVEVTALAPGRDTISMRAGRSLSTLALLVHAQSERGEAESFVAAPAQVTLPEIPGVTSWATLADVDVHEGAAGLARPAFGDRVRSLHEQEVKLQGFMVPLETAERQRRFLLTPSPMHCFFCLPGGPSSMVEVQSRDALDFGFEPIVVSGVLELLEADDSGLFYRMVDAVQVR